MCGIAGIAGERPLQPGQLERMAGVLAHRGPDDEGFHVDGGVGLAHRRLAIVDLSPLGHQPMTNEDGSLWIVFNGEIYNARDIAQSLGSSHSFRSHSDTEVILHAYEEWGESCVERFNGMWGFALWDSKKRRLFCSRDRFGVKPFYYHLSPTGTFVFASEIKGVLAAGLQARVNEAYAARVIAEGTLDDSAETMFLGVKQLPPAHNLILENGRMKLMRYWDVSPDLTPGSGDSAGGLRDLLTDAVRIRMLASDVQVGSCLSGGLDSSTIVSLASAVCDEPVATFSLEYAEQGYDESNWARIVADDFACDARYVRPHAHEFFDVLERMAWFQDEPAAGPGLFSQWRVMELAAPHVKVLLDGQGGDETMAGYRYYLEPYLRALAGRAAKGDMDAGHRLVSDFPKVAGSWGLGPVPAFVRAFGGQPARKLYDTIRGTRGDDSVSPEVLREARRAAANRTPLRTLGDPVNDRLYADITRDVIPSLLHYEDRNSMAFSIEARTPFLDYRLVEHMLSIPGTEKIREGQTKWLFRQAVKGITPQAILDRRDKMGYKTPVAEWFRDGQLPEVKEMLLDHRTREHGVLNLDAVARQLDEHVSGHVDISWQIYRWLSLEQWFRTFIDRRDPALGPVQEF